VIVIFAPTRADQVEAIPPTGCCEVVDDPWTCPNLAAYRAEFAPMPGYDRGPVAFVCPEHALPLRSRPDLASIRSVFA
jgi:rubredoxin